MDAVITYGIADTTEKLEQILALQAENHYSALTDTERAEDGFLTLKYTASQLARMSEQEPQIVAMQGNKVVGYVLPISVSIRSHVDVLEPMLNELELLLQKGVTLLGNSYIVCGQTCIHKHFRGRNMLAGLYGVMKEKFFGRYEQCVAEIAVANHRSLRAHEKIGFRSIHTYPDAGQDWHIAVWNWL